jgi:hypothetical protein
MYKMGRVAILTSAMEPHVLTARTTRAMLLISRFRFLWSQLHPLSADAENRWP